MATLGSPEDEAAIRSVEAAYDAAWQAGDVEAILACLTEDAVLINPRGDIARGRSQIRRELESVLRGSGPGINAHEHGRGGGVRHDRGCNCGR
ncbi:SgcJ/EcaC family oxidoreductase [Caldilinea sp.]|uniref:YybH family protein n=1 Tax=Caldilinea sp. TaxID=2293560 RepID=UPI0035B53B0C